MRLSNLISRVEDGVVNVAKTAATGTKNAYQLAGEVAYEKKIKIVAWQLRRTMRQLEIGMEMFEAATKYNAQRDREIRKAAKAKAAKAAKA